MHTYHLRGDLVWTRAAGGCAQGLHALLGCLRHVCLHYLAAVLQLNMLLDL
jgi:hypothetical protein